MTAPITAIECEHALRRAVRVCPSASCLAQAIAAACLLRRDDRNSTLTIGIGFGPDHGFRAHAWVESDGVSVCGRRAAAEYRVLLRDVISRTGGLYRLNEEQIAERGARMARREAREYREYLSAEQRSQPGCPAREVLLDQPIQATTFDTHHA